MCGVVSWAGWQMHYNVKVKFIEMIWDNYQGGSGKPITRSVLMVLDGHTDITSVMGVVRDRLQREGVRSNDGNDIYDYKGILRIEILPEF